MAEQLRYPDFVIGGAPKSGTSSLYFWLAEHPQICASKVKETFFLADDVSRFNTNRNFINHGIEAYAEFFKHCPSHTKAFEATAHYLYSNTAREELNKLPSKPKMIFILRNPIAQVYSHYRMLRYRVKTFTGDLEEYLGRPNVTEQVRYAYYLEKWIETLGKDRVKVLVFEDLMQRKREVLGDVCDFLEVDNQFFKDFDFQHRNETVAIKSSKMHQFGLRVQPLIPHALQKLFLPVYLKLNSGRLPSKNESEQMALRSLEPLAENVQSDLMKLMPELNLSYWNR